MEKNNAYIRIANKYSVDPILSNEEALEFFRALPMNYSPEKIETILAELTDEIYNRSYGDDYEEYPPVDYPQNDDEVILECT